MIPFLPSAPTGEAQGSTRPTSVAATRTQAELTTEPHIPPAVASPLDLSSVILHMRALLDKI